MKESAAYSAKLINLYFLKFVFKNTLSFRFICIHRVKREITPTTYRAFVWSSVSLNTNSIKYPNSNIRKIIRNIPITIIPRNNCFNLILINASTILFFFFFACPLTVRSLAKWRKSKHKCSVLHKSSIEELPLNLVLNPPFCQTAVCALHEQCTHHRRSVKMSNLQILLKIPIVRG